MPIGEHVLIPDYFGMNPLSAPSSDQAAEIGLFLHALDVDLSTHATGSDGYVIVRLSDHAASLFEARNSIAVLLAFRMHGVVYPLSIVFLKGATKPCFCHSTLLIESYGTDTRVGPLLEKALREFFARDAGVVLAALDPSWTDAPLEEQQDCRILWHVRPEIKIAAGLLRETVGAVCEVPLFPTVYNYNNPYDENLLEAALPLLGECKEALVLGSGAGLEALCIALKYRIRVDATDINPVAVANTIAACRRTGTDSLVKAWVSDGLNQVTQSYDAVLFEAPLATENPFQKDSNRYDLDGKLLREVLSQLPAHLNRDGRMYLMSRPVIAAYMPARGLQSRVLRNFTAKSDVAIHEIRLT